MADGLIGLGIELSAMGLSSVVGAVGNITSTADKASSAFLSWAGSIGSFVEKISPAAVDLFGLALDDLMATIGQSLLPVFNVFTDVVQKLGDFIANIDLGPIMETVTSVLNTLSDAFFQILEALKPLIEVALKLLNDLLIPLLPLIDAAADLLVTLIDALTPLIEVIVEVVQNVLVMLMPALKAIIDAVNRLVQAVKPFIELFANMLMSALEKMQPVIEAVSKALVEFVNTAMAIVAILTHQPQLLFQQEQEKKEKTGDKKRATAAKGVSVLGIEEVSRRALQAAGRVGQKTEGERTAGGVEAILRLLETVAPHFNKDDPQGAKDAIKRLRDHWFSPPVEED